MVGDANWLALMGARIRIRQCTKGFATCRRGGSTMGQVENLLDRPMLYNNIDGVGELGLGFMFVAFATLMWLQAHSAPDAIWHRVYTLLVLMGIVLPVIHYGSKAIKERITYPRTGFVAYRKRDTVWLPMVLGAL